ncbi:hypothetical protein C8A05DRAFT_48130 [Staphylotrichum tortipilum]|uniref:HMA domain-containing protein n=1 Tax=Staphylotrichum tortipilum TaxID=2831512 RepID=A0AAN6MBL5_9PEZI|nr:hypothetical protein C8A05DRAFT_48130 [Staphylotrichum longicolle]
MSPFNLRRPTAATAAASRSRSNPLPLSSDEDTVSTSFLLANLHCPTCVSTIKRALHEACADRVKWVSPNVVTSVVTVEHAPDASLVRHMRDALEESGFEVCGISTSAGDVSDLDLDPALDLDLNAADRAGESEYNGESSNTNTTTNNNTHTDTTTMAPQTSAFSRWFMPSTSRALQSHQARAHLENCEQCRTGGPINPAEPVEKHILETVLTHPSTTQPTPTTPTNNPPAPEEPFIVIEPDEAGFPPPLYRATLAVGGMTCSACANMITSGLKKHDWVLDAVVNLLTNSATVDLRDESRAADLVTAVEDLGYDATLDSVSEVKQAKPRSKPQTDLWRATLAVGGMTCASCANGITRELTKKEWIHSVAVNLLTNSATVDFSGGRMHADAVVAAVSDLGYDAVLTEAGPLSPDPDPHDVEERTVEIRIDGLYCPHCPDRVTSSLAGFRRNELRVLAPPTRQRPILKINYRPDAPGFTLRRILAAISACDPSFTSSLYHPPTLEERSKQIQRKHRLQILYRAVFTGVVCIPSFIIGIVYMSLLPDHLATKHYLMAPWTSGISRAQVALFVLATPVYFFAADLFHRRAIKEIRTLWRRGSRVPVLQRFYRFGSMNTLMSLGTTVAYISSVSQMIAAAVEGAEEVNDSNFYFDSVVFLTFFLLLGRLIESYSKARTGDAVEMLGKLRPTTAVLVEGYGTEKEEDVVVKADLLDFGDVVRVAHGASPPADGTVVRGESSFDESSLTGESRLVKKGAGDEVFSGTVNKANALLVRITGVPGSSLLDQIVNIVREGQTKRAPIEQVADMLTSYFVPVVTFMAVLTWILWLSLGLSGRIPAHYLDVTSGGWVAFSLQFAISVFVVACPCGLALAAPTAIFVGSGLAAKHGILAKGGGEAFEKASRIDCVVFDKTGTLTMGGEPKITDSKVYAADDEEKTSVLTALKAVEENSTHPIAKAIVSFCTTALPTTSPKPTIDNLQELPGKGMQATCHIPTTGTTFHLAVGNESLLSDLSVPIPPATTSLLTAWKSQAKSLALVATTPNPATHPWTLSLALSISDPLRPEAAPIVRALQSRGTRVYMLSGDNPTTAAAVAVSLGIPAEQVMAGVLPAGKAERIKQLQATLVQAGGKRRGMVAMVGDGINDAPALATADVGVAIGSGADVAISSADFVLVKSDLAAVVGLVELSRVVLRRIKFNFAWAVVYNCVALPVAAGAFYPLVSRGQHIRLDPVWASLAMALSSISVVLSSLALRVRVRGIGYRERRIEGVVEGGEGRGEE